MNIKRLLDNIGIDIDLIVDRKTVTAADLNLAIKTIEVHTRDNKNVELLQLKHEVNISDKAQNSLETLGYSFEIGV